VKLETFLVAFSLKNNLYWHNYILRVIFIQYVVQIHIKQSLFNLQVLEHNRFLLVNYTNISDCVYFLAINVNKSKTSLYNQQSRRYKLSTSATYFSLFRKNGFCNGNEYGHGLWSGTAGINQFIPSQTITTWMHLKMLQF
jgi:hypothetical protein